MQYIYEFQLTRFNLVGDEVVILDIKYKMPASSKTEAIYKLGMTFSSSFPVTTIEEGVRGYKGGTGFPKGNNYSQR